MTRAGDEYQGRYHRGLLAGRVTAQLAGGGGGAREACYRAGRRHGLCREVRGGQLLSLGRYRRGGRAGTWWTRTKYRGEQLPATCVTFYCQGRLLPGGRGGAGPGRRVPPPRGGRLPLPGPGDCAGRPVGGGEAGAGAAGAGGGAALGGGRGAAGDPPRPRRRGGQLPARGLPLHLPVAAGQGPVRGET